MERPRYIQPVVCADGTRISIQANGYRAFCTPQSEFGPWAEFDVLVEEGQRVEALAKYEQPSPGGVVYHYVPVEEVRALIEAHGGTSDDWEGFEPPSVEVILGLDFNEARDAARALGVEETLAALAAIIADKAADREMRACAAERARWVAGVLP